MRKIMTVLEALALAGSMAAVASGAELEEIHQKFQAAQVNELDFSVISCESEIGTSKNDSVSVDVLGSDKETYLWEVGLRGSKLRIEQRNRHTFSKGSNRECRVTVKLPNGLPVKAGSVSGGLKLSGAFRSVDAHSTSGDIKLDLSSGEAAVSTVSGAAKLRGLGGGLDFQSVSGGLDAQWSKAPSRAEVRIKSVSGDSVLRLPAGMTLNASLKSVSGELHNDLPTDPSAGFVVRANTVSGGLALLKAER